MRQDITQQLASYKGILHWDAFTTSTGINRPAVDIELFCAEHPIPIRKPKVTEINTIDVMDPSGHTLNNGVLFFGAPDLLQFQLSGWIITPVSSNQFAPVDASGTALGLGNMTYSEIISAYIEGRMNQTTFGGWQRRDPDYYITPHGQKYTKPTIAVWEPQYSTNMRKQPFSMTLYMEK